MKPVRIPIGAMLAPVLLLSPAARADLVHRWSFSNPAGPAPDGTALADRVGTATATLQGNFSAFTGTALVLQGSGGSANTSVGDRSAGNLSGYIDLPNGVISSETHLSIEIWATPLSARNYQRLFDFGRVTGPGHGGGEPGEVIDVNGNGNNPGTTTASDNLMLSFCVGTDLNAQRMEALLNGGNIATVNTAAATRAGTRYHYVMTFEDGVGSFGTGGGRMNWYRDGALVGTGDVAFHLSDLEDVNNWLGRSQWTGDRNAHASYDEVRLYDHVLSTEEIAANLAAGPDTLVAPADPEPAPVPKARWSFNSAAGPAAAGTVFTDVSSGEAATVRGNGATLDGNALILPGTTNGNQTAAAISAYLDLANGLLSARPSLSFEAWITPLSSKNWQRVFDFGNGSITSGAGATPGEIIDGPLAPGFANASDNLMLSFNIGGTLGSHRLETKLDGTSTSTLTLDTDLSATTTAGTEYHFVLAVQDAAGAFGSTGCQVKWFRNGELQGSQDLPYRLPALDDVNNWIGRSQWSGDSNSHMAINELRLHDRALSAAEALASYNNGANTVYPPPVAVADSATIHPGQKVLLDVLANDTGSPGASTLRIVAPPSTGTATVGGGKILYAHSGPATSPLSFTYRVGNSSGSTSDGTVTIGFATSLRLTNPALAMPAAPPASQWRIVDALPGLTFNQPICIASIPGNSSRLFVCERMAKVKHVPDLTSTSPTQNVFLDLQQVVQGRTPTETIESGANAENGLLGLAFHPDYATNGHFYVAYTVRIGGGSYYQRISRFTVSTDPAVAAPATERILLQQLDEGANHNGGDLHFGPDGYLYYAAGDEENSNRGPLNSQKLDGDFHAGIFRIDVDKKPGNLEPNPHAAIPTDGGIARFSVPADNPYLPTGLGGTWDGTYNGTAVTPLENVRTEFWATGLRHVWRMSFDPATGDLWAGDVGQNTYEEVNKIVKGGNYGWGYREGAHPYNGPLGSPPPGFSGIDPFYEYVHTAVAGGSAEFKGNSVVGGYVYRGTRFPALAGKYIFSDSVSGHVWQMDTSTGATNRLTSLPGAYGVFSTMGLDPFNQDLLLAAYNGGRIMRLTTGDASDNSGLPATLTETGLFADLSDLSPAPGLLPYSPNLSFWSDHAIKRRWFTIPDATSKMTWSKDGNWNYPTGMVWVKHFDLELSRGNPATRKRIETRVLVKTDSGSYGVSYRWNEAQTEAILVEDAGTEFDLAIDDHGASRVQRWQIPGRSSCITCHTPQGGHALSFNSRQLNRDETIFGYSGNQLDLLAANDFLHNTPDPVATLGRHVRPDETEHPLERRARSYFDVNCAYCHQSGGSVSGIWDGRAQLTLEQTGLIHGAALNDGGDPLNRYIVPGNTARSIVLHRMAGSNGSGRMPPLGSTELDHANLQLVTDWINTELVNRPLYDPWRDGFFAALDPEGARTADPDGDGVNNYDEFLLGSSPVSGGNPWQASAANGKLTFLRKSHRYYAIETSDSLGNWQPWSIPEIDRAYQVTDTLTEIPLPVSPGGRQFFRFQVTEP